MWTNLTSCKEVLGKTGNTDKTKVGGSSYPASGAQSPFLIHNSAISEPYH